MTTPSDGIAALLAEPGSALVRCQLLDWWEEHGVADHRGEALKLVLAHRAADGPRLLYADVCEREGDAERAEFIRVQVELEPLEGIAHDCGADGQWEATCPACGAHGYIEELNRRMEALTGSCCLDAEVNQCIAWNVRPSWGRGFVASLTCTAEDWLRHADAILAAHPVERVRLTTMPTLVSARGGLYARLSGRAKELAYGAGRDWRQITPDLLAAEWPGVAFELPDIDAGVFVPGATVTFRG